MTLLTILVCICRWKKYLWSLMETASFRNERIFVVIPLQPTGSHEQRNQRNREPVTSLLHITNRKYHMAYPVVSFPVTSDNNKLILKTAVYP